MDIVHRTCATAHEKVTALVTIQLGPYTYLRHGMRLYPAAMKRISPVLLVALVFSLSTLSLADTVVPVSEVTSHVVVRENPTSQSARVGILRPGEQAEIIGSVPNWHHVTLANGREGFVSKRWTRVIAGARIISDKYT